MLPLVGTTCVYGFELCSVEVVNNGFIWLDSFAEVIGPEGGGEIGMGM